MVAPIGAVRRQPWQNREGDVDQRGCNLVHLIDIIPPYQGQILYVKTEASSYDQRAMESPSKKKSILLSLPIMSGSQ